MSIDADLDRLYQLPPAQFVAERNAIAKRAGGREAEIRALPKPTLPVWAVNQLHWREPEIYQSLVAKAEDLRSTHKAVLAGRRGDLRAASRAHEEAVEAALKAAVAIAGEGGNAPSDTTRQTIGTTLRGLPAGDPPGRLKQALAPGGFATLAGLPSRGRVLPAPAHRRKTAPSKSTGRGATAARKPDTAALKRARQAAAVAERALANADQQARREEFEAARAAREAERAQRRVTRAQESLDAAQTEFKDAEREAAAAAKKRDAAQSRVVSADRALAAARQRHDAAQRDVRLAESG
jgi:hypothetical protein